MSGPATGRKKRGTRLRALLPCLVLAALDTDSARAQTVTPDLFNPVRGSFVGRRIFRCARPGTTPPITLATRQAIHPNDGSAAAGSRRRHRGSARSRPMALPAANGAWTPASTRSTASASKPKFYPGQAKPKPPPGPGSRAIAAAGESTADCACRSRRRRAPTRRRCRRRWPARSRPAAAQAAQGRRRSVRRGRRLCRQLSDQIGGRTLRRLRYQSRPPARAARLAVLCRRAGILGGLRLGAPCARCRSARIVHRLRQSVAADRRRRGFAGADRCRPAEFQRPYRRPPRRHPRSAPDRADAPAGRHRQSRQPEHPGRARALSDLHHARRHLRLRPEFQSPGCLSRRHRRPHRRTSSPSSPTAPCPPTTTAISTSMAASAASPTS